MFTRSSIALCRKVLSSGLVLDGTFHPTTPNRLLAGVATMPDGRVFKGTFDPDSGAPTPGSQLEEDGDLYKGEFNAQWQRCGQGESFLLDGTHYKGLFADDMLVKGTVRVPDGVDEVVFEGELRDEEFVKGTLKRKDCTYVGEFQNNQPHGKGRLSFHTGAEQEGTFFNGMLHGGNCRQRLESGFLYVGEFEEGMIKRGQLYSPTYTYDGQFNKDGRAHGEGVQTYLAATPKLVFTGMWMDGNLTRGICHDEDGNPVDYLNDTDLQKEVFGDKNTAMSEIHQSSIRDAAQRGEERHDALAKDAQMARDAGVPPPIQPVEGDDDFEKELEEMERKQSENNDLTSLRIARAASTPIKKPEGVDIDPKLAKKGIVSAASQSAIAGDHMSAQLARFKANLKADPKGRMEQNKPYDRSS